MQLFKIGRLRLRKDFGFDHQIAADIDQLSPKRSCFPPTFVGSVASQH